MLAALTLLSATLSTVLFIGVDSIAILCGLFVSFIGFGLFVTNESNRSLNETGKKVGHLETGDNVSTDMINRLTPAS